MKGISLAVMVLALTGTTSLGKSRYDEQSVTVYIRDRANIPGSVLVMAEATAHQMFAKAGVRVDWKIGQPKTQMPCQTLVLDITDNTPVSFFPGALGYAQEFEGVHITVFYDRVSRMVNREILSMLLAHVFVHEITHVLEGVDRHSDEGVMKAHWSARDLESMAHMRLPFASSDLLLIHSGIARRSSIVHRAEANSSVGSAP